MDSLRTIKTESKLIEKKYREINKVLILIDHPPLQKSELVHISLDKVLPVVKAESNGQIVIDL